MARILFGTLEVRLVACAAALLSLYPTDARAQVASAHLTTAEDLDCKNLDFSLVNPKLIGPGQFDPSQVMKGVRPDFIQQIQRSMKLDPNGLCHYRDLNKALPKSSNRVVFMGDSITEQWKLGSPELFTANVIDRGVAGQNTTQMLLRFRQDVLDLHPRVVHIMGGVNDINLPFGTQLTQSNIMSMVELAEQHKIIVILGAITPSNHFWAFPNLKPGPQILALNSWLKDYARQKHLIYVDYYSPMVDQALGLRSDLGNDGLHPNRSGYTLMTPLAKAAITRALQSHRHSLKTASGPCGQRDPRADSGSGYLR